MGVGQGDAVERAVPCGRGPLLAVHLLQDARRLLQPRLQQQQRPQPRLSRRRYMIYYIILGGPQALNVRP